MDNFMSMNTEMSVDVEELDDFIHNELPGILLNATSNFAIAGFCLQAVMDAFQTAVADLDDDDE